MVETGGESSTKIKDSLKRTGAFIRRHERGILVGVPAFINGAVLFDYYNPFVGLGVGLVGAGAFMRDSRSNDLQKKYDSDISQSIAVKDLKEFYVTPENKAADFLEQRFGITFPEKYGKPRVLVFGKDKRRERIKLERYSYQRYDDGEYIPEYSLRYHAILMSETKDLIDLEDERAFNFLFSTMNAYLVANNPEVAATLNKFEPAWRLVGYGREVPEFNTETYVALQCFSEGIVRYTANIAADRLEDEKEYAGKVLKFSVPVQANFVVDEKRATIDDMLPYYDKLQKYNNALNNAFHGKGYHRTRAKRARNLKSENEGLTYNVGAYFMMEAVDALCSLGLGHRAYDLLMQTPPTTIAEITNPQKFVTDNFLKERGR